MATGWEGFSKQTASWFSECIGTPTEVQIQGWPAIASGGHALISAPTGTGKTLAAFLVFVDQLARLHRAGALREQLSVLYISPLKALGNDIRENLKRPIEGICPAIRTAVRTGDTEASERRAMAKHPPHILITTPESLFLLLSSHGGREMLRPIQTVILDELHAMIDTKRGAHLMLSLARLDALCGRNVQRIALSATIRPLESAARYLAGEEPVHIVAPQIEKSRDILVQSVVPDLRQLPEKSVWPEIVRQVFSECEGQRTVIAFLEGRSSAEKLAHLVNLQRPGFARTHHGCVSKQQRLEAERQLREGELRLLCATSSMELGIDVGEVDKVLQIGCPFSVSGALQRLGRAGHNPGRTSVMRIFPRTAAEILPAAMTARAALVGAIEPLSAPQRCFDIVAQHLVSMAAEGSYEVAELHRILSAAHSFRALTIEDIEGILRMLAGDYEHEGDRPARPRLIYDRIHGTIAGEGYSRMLALSSGGTIPDRGWYPAMLPDGTRLGELDEEMVFESRVGDRILLGAFGWRITDIRRDRVIVESAEAAGARIPFWHGDGRGRAYEVGLRFGGWLRELNEAHQLGRLGERLMRMPMDEAGAENSARHLLGQFSATGCLPDDQTIILEHFSDGQGEHQLMIHSVFGRRVNMALQMLLSRRASEITGQDVLGYSDDDGLLLYLSARQMPRSILTGIDPGQAEGVIRAVLKATPLFLMAFRYNAARALMMGVRRGGRVPLWVQRMRGAEALTDALRHPDHPLLRETERECLSDYMDLPAMRDVLEKVLSGRIRVLEIDTAAPSPMALPLRRQVEAELMYEYSPTPMSAVMAAQQALQRERIAPAPEQLVEQQRQTEVRDSERLHQLLMAEGDLIAGEADAPLSFFESLGRAGRILYIEPGLWIAMEQRELYRSALEEGDGGGLARIVRRALRYRGPQTAQSLVERYQIGPGRAEAALGALIDEGTAVLFEGQCYHQELYRRAVSGTIRSRRAEAVTREGEALASMLAQRTRFAGGAREQLGAAIESLVGLDQPAEAWEGILLPARVSGYRGELLDALLSEGRFLWTMQGGKRAMIRFSRQQDIDWDWAPSHDEGELDADEIAIVKALSARGASFAQALEGLLGGRSALTPLMSLMRKGLVRCDSFVPVRLMMEQGSLVPKRRARARAGAQQAGRWELARPEARQHREGLLERAFERYTLLCRESCCGVKWPEALETLRTWEYTGRVRRGYYIRGLSGAQFIRAQDYARALAELSGPPDELIWLNATDPMQAWGRLIPHREGRAFLLVPGTLVALQRGEVVAVVERGGEVLRAFDEAALPEALSQLKHAFQVGRVLTGARRITLRSIPEGCEQALLDAGFSREMMDFTLWRG